MCSVCAPLRLEPKREVKTGYSKSPERDARKRNVLCFQFIVVFPSCTSRVSSPVSRSIKSTAYERTENIKSNRVHYAPIALSSAFTASFRRLSDVIV